MNSKKVFNCYCKTTVRKWNMGNDINTWKLHIQISVYGLWPRVCVPSLDLNNNHTYSDLLDASQVPFGQNIVLTLKKKTKKKLNQARALCLQSWVLTHHLMEVSGGDGPNSWPGCGESAWSGVEAATSDNYRIITSHIQTFKRDGL